MKIQISDIVSGKGRHKNIDYTFEMNPFEFEGDIIKPVSSCSVQGDISSKDNILLLNINIKVNLEMNCSRCLDTFIYPIDIDIEERFTNNKELQDNEEIIFVDSDTLDIAKIVENVIISTLPIKRLCTDDCKGLCYQCGKNLNEGSCQCETNDVDLRLAKLQELFGNKEV